MSREKSGHGSVDGWRELGDAESLGWDIKGRGILTSRKIQYGRHRRRRRRVTRTRRLMESGIHVVRHLRRQRSGRMHYSRRRLQGRPQNLGDGLFAIKVKDL